MNGKMKGGSNYEPYKYRLHELFRKLTVADAEIAWKYFPGKLQITPRTLKSWILIRRSDNQEIPARALICFANFFEIEPSQLYTMQPDFESRMVICGNLEDLQ